MTTPCRNFERDWFGAQVDGPIAAEWIAWCFHPGDYLGDMTWTWA